MKLVWLRRDLRLYDNSALQAALESDEPVMALFIATPKQWTNHDMAPIQADLIVRRLEALQQELGAVHIPLLYHQVMTFSDSAEWIVEFAEQHGISEILFNKEYELNEHLRDKRVLALAEEKAIKASGFDDKCVIPPGQLLNKQGEYFKVFTPFKRAWMSQLQMPAIPSLPTRQEQQIPVTLQAWQFNPDAVSFDYPRVSSEDWPASFEEIRQQLRLFCLNEADQYHQTRDFPALEKTSQLSPYLAIGAVSARQCLARLLSVSSGLELSDGAQTWLSELVWREFYQHLLYFRPDLSRSENFHSWANHLAWDNKAAWFDQWKEGKTGFPIVDAAMRQLNQTGWMHNRLRMIVASFLTKDLHIDWRWGERYFMSTLIDGDYAANNGGWQWCASTGCDGQPYFRIFNPVSQSEKFDPNGEFIRKWVPELQEVPLKYLHAPWTWPCVSKLSYPAPMVDHKQERAITLSLYKEAKDS